MAAPLAPIVLGPLVPSSTHVGVSGALNGATVTVLANGADTGSHAATGNGNVLVKLRRSLAPGEQVTATQTLGGITSLPSNQPVTVIAVPSPLPAPVFASPVTECMNAVLLGGLVPGASVNLKAGGAPLASFVTTGTSAWATFNPAPLDDGMILTAVQTVGGAVSATASSPPLAAVTHREGLPPPMINQPVTACETGVLASALVPAGELELSQNGRVQLWTNIAASYWATGVHPLAPGKLAARQRLPGCGGQSNVIEVPVGPATTPGAPVGQPFCPAAQRIIVTGLHAGGVLTLWSKVIGATVETEIGSVGIGASVQQVDLPAVIGGTGPDMHIVMRQTRCNLTSPPGIAHEFARPGSGALPAPEPRVVGPLLDCMRAVPAAGLFNGVLIHAASARTGAVLSDVMIVTSPQARILTWFPLTAGDEVEVRQAGCSAPPTSARVRVDSLPSPLPPPKIRRPVRPTESTVVVQACLPGSRVHLLVDWQERAATDQTWTGEAVFHLGQPLVEGQKLWAVQTMCTASSTREGSPVVVSKGNISAEVTPNSAPGGKAASFVVHARDAETGTPLTGLTVMLGSATVGTTGTAFGWTPPTTGTSVTGVVKGGAAYTDASFNISVRQAVPVTVNLFPGPVVFPGKVWQSDVVWTLTPSWAGASPVKVNANAQTAMVPPPPAVGDRISVSVALKAHLQGEIEGIVWPPDVIDIGGYLADIALTGASHAISARFWYDVVDVPTTDDDGNVTGWETKLYAGVALFSIT